MRASSCLLCSSRPQLKEDGHTSVGNWPWSLVVIPSAASAFFFLLVWTFVHYHEAGKALEVRWNHELVRQTLSSTDVDMIETYHERYVFRDLMMVFALLVVVVYAIMVNAAGCPSSCPTPFTMFGTSVVIINVLRLLIILIHGYFQFHRLREMAAEVRYYKSWRDERRFRDSVVPSVHPRFRINPYSVIEAALFIGAAAFMILATSWVERGDCADSCPRGYHLTKHLVVTMYLLESLYLLSAVGLVFFRRSLGLERLESLVSWIMADRLWKQELLERKYRGNGDTVVN